MQRLTTVAPPAFLAELFPLVIFLIEIVFTLYFRYRLILFHQTWHEYKA